MIFQGSSYNLPAHGSGGARARFNLKPAEKIAAGARARRKEGVWGRNSAAPEPKRSPAALLIQSRSQQKSFLDLLEEEIGGARKSEIEKKTFLLAGERQRAAAWRSVKRSAQSRFGFGHIIAHAKQKYGLEAVFLFCVCPGRDSNPHALRPRPSNVCVCQFHHLGSDFIGCFRFYLPQFLRAFPEFFRFRSAAPQQMFSFLLSCLRVHAYNKVLRALLLNV